jgi:hypothetical protein
MIATSSLSFPLLLIGSCVLNHEVHEDVVGSHTLSENTEDICPPKTFDDKKRTELINGININILAIFKNND